MTTDRDVTRALDIWLAEGSSEVNDRVLDMVEDRIWAQKQRPAWLFPRRDRHVNNVIKLAAGLAAVLVVAVVSYNLLPGLGMGGPGASPMLLARGDFVIRDWGRVEFESTRDIFGVTGRLAIGRGRGPEWPLTVDLRCSRTTEDGLLMIGGHVSAAPARQSPLWDEGTPAAVVVQRGSPVRAAVWVGSIVNWPSTQTTDCLAYLDAWLSWSRTSLPGDAWLRDDIEGTVEFGP